MAASPDRPWRPNYCPNRLLKVKSGRTARSRGCGKSSIRQQAKPAVGDSTRECQPASPALDEIRAFMTVQKSILPWLVAALATLVAGGQGFTEQALAQSGNWPTRLLQSPSPGSVPAAPSDAPSAGTGWSGQSGGSGNPLMGAEAIRAAAADFGNCIERMWPEAARRGVSRATFDRFTAGLTPDLSIMDKLDAQPEFNKAPWDYLDVLVSDERIARGREVLAQYAPTFAAVARSYGVDPAIIAAIWGVESNYRTLGGDRPVIRSTATLACVGRRQD